MNENFQNQHNLDLLICLGLVGASGESCEVLKPRMGRICATGSLAQRKGTLPRHHKTLVLQLTAADLEKNLPVKGGKGSNAKHFTLYHEIEYVYHERTGAILGLSVREKF